MEAIQTVGDQLNKSIIFGLILIGIFSVTLSLFQERTPKIEGVIDQSFYIELSRLLHDDPRAVRISSRGGSFYWALRSAKLLQESKVEIRIEHECLSACASVLMAANKNITIDPGAQIAFHRPIGTWVYINDYLDRSLGRTLRGIRQFENARKTVQLYKDSGINPDVLLALMLRQGIECIKIEGNGILIGPDEVEIFLRDDFYIANSKMLSQFGWNLKGYPDAENLVKMGKALSERYSQYSYRIEDPNFRFNSSLTRGGLQINSIEPCK